MSELQEHVMYGLRMEAERDTARDTIAHVSRLLDSLYDRLRGEVSQDVLDGIEHISMVLNR